MSSIEKPKENNDLRLSVSKCKVFESCAKQYNYSYNLKLPQKEQSYHTFGKFIHQVLEHFHLEYINGSKEQLHIVMGRMFKIALSEYKVKMTDEAIKEAYEIVDSYLKKITAEKAMLPTILSVEKNFSFHISDNVVLNGMIDRIQLDSDGVLHVADYKTTKNKKYLKNDFFQLASYAYVLYCENTSLTKIRGSYILLRHNFEYITKEFSLNEILAIKDKYEEYAKNIKDEALWRPNLTQMCRFCSYVDICPEGSAFVKPKKENISHGEVKWQ